MHLARHRHRQQRPAVERVVEDDHCGRPVAARAILTAFSFASAPELTRIDFCSAPAHGDSSARQPADVDVRLVHADHEALVQVLVGLLVDRVDDGREAVARVLAADPAGEVDERAPVDVGHSRPFGIATTSRGVETPFETYRRRSASTRSPTRCSVEAMWREYDAAVSAGTTVIRLASAQRSWVRASVRSAGVATTRCCPQGECSLHISAQPVRFATPRDLHASATIRAWTPPRRSSSSTTTPAFAAARELCSSRTASRSSARRRTEQGALDAIDTLHPDVVLLDIQLPDMDGFAVLDRLGDEGPAGRSRLEPGCLRLQRPDRRERGSRFHRQGRPVGGRNPFAPPVTRRTPRRRGCRRRRAVRRTRSSSR